MLFKVSLAGQWWGTPKAEAIRAFELEASLVYRANSSSWEIGN